MDSARIVPAMLVCIMSLTGCYGIVGGESSLGTEMYRASDGANATCDSGVFKVDGLFGLLNGEENARRIMNACILACRRQGLVENGTLMQIDEKASLLRPEEGWGNTPRICQGAASRSERA